MPNITSLASSCFASLMMGVYAEPRVIDSVLLDSSRARTIPLRIYSPSLKSGEEPLPVVLVSHGGTGSLTGFTQLSHLGTALASSGFVAVHIGHRPSDAGSDHRQDRPADVSFVLDQLEMNELDLQLDLWSVMDFDRVGHVGHSYGAYTAHAVGGAQYDHGSYRDDRIDAIAMLSPQGADQFGAYDDGPANNSWGTIRVPTLDMVGELELDTNVLGTIVEPGWRLTPFVRYQATADRHLSIVPGADHGDMGSRGDAETQAAIASSVTAFFDVYLAGQRARRDEIGAIAALPGTIDRERTADVNNDGLATPADLNAWILSYNTGEPVSDVNANGQITPADFTAWVIAYNERTR